MFKPRHRRDVQASNNMAQDHDHAAPSVHATGGNSYSDNLAADEPPTAIDHAERMPLWQAVRTYPKVVTYFACLTSAVILWGYDLVIVGSVTAVPAFQKDFGELFEDEWIIPAGWLSLWLAFGPLGSLFGSITGGFIQDRIGRRYSLMTGAIIASMAVAVIFTSNLPATLDARRGMFLVGKTIQGFAVGIIKIQCLTYVSENAPTVLRGPAMALFPTATLLGQLIGSAVVFSIEDVETSNGYLIAFGSQWILSIFPFTLSIVMPESPAYLVRKNRMEEAYRAAQRLFEPKASASGQLAKIKANVEAEDSMAHEVSYMNCFNSAHRRRTWTVVFANLIPTLFGLNLLSTASYFLQTVGLDSQPSLVFLITGIVLGLVANGASVWVLSRVGRRSVTLVTTSIAGAFWFGMGIAGSWPGISTAWVSGVFLNIIIVICGIGAWPASYAIMGETSALRLRAKSQAIGGVFAQISSIFMNLVLPYVFNPDAGNARAQTGFLFFGLCVIGVIFTWLWVPEMKGRSVAEIDEMFNLKLPSRDFKNWSSGAGYSSQEKINPMDSNGPVRV